VPLIEAMSHKIPIVALSRAAVPETLGPEAMLSDTLDELLISEMMNHCIHEPSTSKWLTDQQHERYQRSFANEVIAERLLSLIMPKRLAQ
jgi:hypothetical protein